MNKHVETNKRSRFSLPRSVTFMGSDWLENRASVLVSVAPHWFDREAEPYEVCGAALDVLSYPCLSAKLGLAPAVLPQWVLTGPTSLKSLTKFKKKAWLTDWATRAETGNYLLDSGLWPLQADQHPFIWLFIWSKRLKTNCPPPLQLRNTCWHQPISQSAARTNWSHCLYQVSEDSIQTGRLMVWFPVLV